MDIRVLTTTYSVQTLAFRQAFCWEVRNNSVSTKATVHFKPGDRRMDTCDTGKIPEANWLISELDLSVGPCSSVAGEGDLWRVVTVHCSVFLMSYWQMAAPHAVALLLLKKCYLDGSQLKSYWPVQKLSFLSKLMEWKVKLKLELFLNPFEAVFCSISLMHCSNTATDLLIES